jgi:hypothetical protein
MEKAVTDRMPVYVQAAESAYDSDVLQTFPACTIGEWSNIKVLVCWRSENGQWIQLHCSLQIGINRIGM